MARPPRPGGSGRPGPRPEPEPRRRPKRSASFQPRPLRIASELGGEQIEGRRAVLELLRAARRPVRSVHVSVANGSDPILDEIAKFAGAKLHAVSAERLAIMAKSVVHQGVIAIASPLAPADLDDLLAAPVPFLVALDGITDPRNLGAVMRSAETAGANGMVIPRHRSARVTPVVAKAAAGAIEYLPIAPVGGIPAALDRAARAGCWTVGLDERGDRTLYDLELADQAIMLVLGAEGHGLSRLTRERCEMLVRIPLHGNVASLNVAAAATLACHEVARRRDKRM